MLTMRRFLLLACALTASCHRAPALQEAYMGPWQQPSSDVLRTLASNGVSGCGELFQKASSASAGEYAVACTETNACQWEGYLVWPAINKIDGPDPLLVWKVGGVPRQPGKDCYARSKRHTRHTAPGGA